MTRIATRTQSLALFVLGFGLFMFTRRSEVVPFIHVMIVVAPIFILRFSRTLPTKHAIWLTLVGFTLAFNIALWGLFQLDSALGTIAVNVSRSMILALAYALPFILDRIVFARKGSSVWTILFFPAAVTAVMFLVSLEGPFDGTAAKTVYAFGPLHVRQLYSLTGLWGFMFLWSLPAALINFAWERRFNARVTGAVVAVFAVIMVAVLGYGQAHLSKEPDGETVKIAAAVMLPKDGNLVSMETVFNERRLLPYEETLTRVEAMVQSAAAQGAALVAFNEHLITINEADIDETRADFARIAADNNIWLSVTYSWYGKESKGANHNVLFNASGEAVADYDKRYLLGIGPIGETSVFYKGPEIIQWADAPFGRIAISICRDMSYPSYARQAGLAGATIMLNAAYDFPESLRPADYARSIENGMTMIRPTYGGVTYAANPNGRIISQMGNGTEPSGLMITEVPTTRLDTLYTRWGDWLGWICLVSTGLLFGGAIFSRQKPG
jgi:apolipoprotein N-acyltransferase